jgi:hypothetical protein
MIFACGLILFATHALQALEKRSPFDVPLAILTPSFNPDGSLNEVFVMFDRDLEGWGIARIDDRYVKDSRSMRLDYLHREIAQRAFLLSPFETEVLDKVCQSLITTLQIYERDLAASRWGRLHYLDAHLVYFFRGFYHLFCAARNSPETLARVAAIEDSLFVSSTESAITDRRIALWRSNPDHIIKLRIAAKELIFQIKQWQKKELKNHKRDVWEDKSRDFAKTYELFIRLYCNVPASPAKR